MIEPDVVPLLCMLVCIIVLRGIKRLWKHAVPTPMPPAGIQETQARSVPPSRERPRDPLPLPAVLQPPLALPRSFPAVPFVQQAESLGVQWSKNNTETGDKNFCISTISKGMCAGLLGARQLLSMTFSVCMELRQNPAMCPNVQTRQMCLSSNRDPIKPLQKVPLLLPPSELA
ncbi:hypothetical protein Anapl_02254 [Anas platyrhynchos]|uniref:Uncharacterized protein n=1 Tax=Anas platyrhynchos TaxID=8839 RepID=R0LT37_ANAPL|nr:hypothetical protein Anapl_02254 [Anas platyrhynchos]